MKSPQGNALCGNEISINIDHINIKSGWRKLQPQQSTFLVSK